MEVENLQTSHWLGNTLPLLPQNLITTTRYVPLAGSPVVPSTQYSRLRLTFRCGICVRMNVSDFISVNHDVCHGKPCFKGTRIMVYLILEMLEAGATFNEIKDGYPSLTADHVKAALEFAARAVETGRYDAALMTRSNYALPA